uniref:Uncharacterized protein n=1 Tax=Cacopsylla melanoneura TaxID=428564 RepID=A0A8D8LPN5_9HEMI
MYELRWGDTMEDHLQETYTKCLHCYQNTTCTLRKILQDYKNAVTKQLNNLEPQMFHYNTKQKRFSVMGWILKKCCGVATQDEFDSLYKSEDLLASHMELIKGTVHADHRSMTEIAAKSDDMTKEFNGVLDKARKARMN